MGKNIKLIQKLISCGYTTDKSVSNISLEQMLEIDKITVPEIKQIDELQKAIKNGTVISFLSETTEEKK